MISKKDVQHIARLARIELTAGEEQKLGKELSAILEFVEKLNEVDTSNVKPLTGGTIEENVMRGDKQIDKSLEGNSAQLFDAAPDKKEEWVKVRTVFEK